MINCIMSKLRHPKKYYVQELGFFSSPKGHKIIGLHGHIFWPCIYKWLTANILT